MSQQQQPPFSDSLILEILEKYRPIWALNHSGAVLSWDMETHMPEEGARPRAVASAEIALLRQKLTLSLKDLVDRAEKKAGLNDHERGVLRLLRRSIDYNTKVPPELLEKLQRTRAESTMNWRIARRKSDFTLFKPYLEKIVDLKREEAEKLGYEGHPYNALLDLGEEGLTVDDMDRIFGKLVPSLRRILEKTRERGDGFPKESHPLESLKYDTNTMEQVNEAIVKLLNMPVPARFRMDISTHPFTTAIALSDVRITTRYEGVNFKASMFATIHESGHAIYGLGVPQEFEFSPIRTGASSGIHESQSRFWENLVGRSREFAQVVTPMLKEELRFLEPYNAEDLYIYFNLVKPSLIRVDADELTYNFHIALRYDIEKRLIAGDLKVSDIPAVWGDTIESYLGVRPESDAKGMLQDIHWSSGGFGGFPSYTIGNVVDGMIWNKITRDLDLGETIQSKDFARLKQWLGDKIYRWGGTYAPKELLVKSFGEPYNPEWLLKYLERKYVGSAA